MRKIISICAVVLTVALVVTFFAACGKKSEGSNSTTNPVQENVVFEPTLNISAENAMVAYGDSRFQMLEYPENYKDTFDYEYAKEHYDFVDMNFDGVLDISIAASKNGNVISYFCWVYDSISNTYKYSEELSALKNISVDADQKQILSVNYEGEKETVVVYSWQEGKLVKVNSFGENGETVPSKVEETIKNNSIGSDKKPAANGNKVEPTKKPSSSKPNKPSTTKPESEGVTLVTDNFDDGWY